MQDLGELAQMAVDELVKREADMEELEIRIADQEEDLREQRKKIGQQIFEIARQRGEIARQRDEIGTLKQELVKVKVAVGSTQADGARVRQGLMEIIERVQLGLLMKGQLSQARDSTQEVEGGGVVG